MSATTATDVRKDASQERQKAMIAEHFERLAHARESGDRLAESEQGEVSEDVRRKLETLGYAQ